MRVGLDIGSTTIKCVVLNDADEVIFDTYERHGSHITEKAKEILERVHGQLRLGGQGPGPKLRRAFCAGGVCHPGGGKAPCAGNRRYH